MIKNLKKTIEKYNLIESGDTLILGLSGGPDSVCLFHLLLELQSDLNFNVVACHINHQLRGDDSEHDENFVKNICKQNDVRCFVLRQDIKGIARENNISEEEAGRLARYGFFDEIAIQIASDGVDKRKIKIATAHNLDDQVETVLMRMLRGTSVDGLAGIDFKRLSATGFHIIRPLLEIEKKDVLRYCEDNNFEYCIDKTNFESVYTRNKIRNELIPYLKEFNANIYTAILNLQKNAGVDKAYFENIVEKNKKLNFSREDFLCLDIAVRTRLIKDALLSVDVSRDVGYEHIMAIDNVLSGGKPNAQVDLPHGNKLIVEYDDIFLVNVHGERVRLFRNSDLEKGCAGDCLNENPNFNKNAILTEEVVYRVLNLVSDGAVLKDVVFKKNRDEVSVYLDYEKISAIYDCIETDDLDSKIEIRKRRNGDYIHIKNGKKKIARLFIDEKIPKFYRDSATIVAIGSEVLCVILSNGYSRVDQRFTVDIGALKKQLGSINADRAIGKYARVLVIEKKLAI
ncbi:MAG: tRNA lysidine(34) synthetase TilS [Eubacteriales bacterium]|nr:tRNA lysidine(34) synthetase TilS [Eubacteriales bacterium]MDY3332547.1 tRNA lysidine(34) synthetase TilS [Gallibacter sp.]